MNEQQIIAAFAQMSDALRASQEQTSSTLAAVVSQVQAQSQALQESMQQNARFLEN